MSTTANLGLTKPTVGGSDSTWGNTLNANFDLLTTQLLTRQCLLAALLCGLVRLQRYRQGGHYAMAQTAHQT